MSFAFDYSIGRLDGRPGCTNFKGCIFTIGDIDDSTQKLINEIKIYEKKCPRVNKRDKNTDTDQGLPDVECLKVE